MCHIIAARDVANHCYRQTRWCYDRTNPAAVILEVADIGRTVTWLLPRDVIGDAYLGYVRNGDYLMLVDRTANGDHTFTLIVYPHGPAFTLEFDAELVWEFLIATHNVLPPCRNRGQCVDDRCDECVAMRAGIEFMLTTLNFGEPPLTV